MYKKTFKIRQFLILCFILVGCENDDSNKKSYLESGKDYFEQGKFRKAKIELKNAIQKNPKSSEAYYFLGLLNEKQRQFRAMKENLIHAVELNSNNVLAGIKLSKLYLLFNELEKSSEEAEKILAVNPQNSDAIAIKAAILFKQFKDTEANVLIDSILKINEDHIDAASLKAAFLLNKKQFKEALNVLKPVMLKHPKVVSLHLLKLRIDSQTNNFEEVISGYKKVSELEPDNIGIKYALAKIYLKVNKFELAKQLLDSIISENPDLVSAKVEMLELLHSTDTTKSIAQVDKYIKADKDNYSLLNALSNWLYRRDYVEKSKQVVQLIVNSDEMSKSEKTAAKLLLAKIDVFSKDYDSAQVHLQNLISQDSNNLQAKLLEAEILITTHKYIEAKKVLEKILINDPKMDKALSLLGKVNLINGDNDIANINYKDALAINPKNNTALKFVVAKAIQEKHNSYAIEMLERSLNFMPSKVSLIIQLIDLNITEKKWFEVKKYINKIENKKNGELIAKFFTGKTLQVQSKYEEAIKIYRELLKVHPNLKDALIQLAECYSKTNQMSVMEGYLSDFINLNPYIADAYILQSQLLSVRNKTSEAIEVISKGIDERALNDSSIYTELARLYKLLGKNDLELKSFVEGEVQNPDDVNLKLFIASNFEQNKEINKAIAKYEEILVIDPTHSVAKNNLATILVEKVGSTDAIHKAELLSRGFKQSTEPFFLDTYGWVQLQSGNLETALSALKKVIILEPNIPIFRYHLAVAYNKLSDNMAAVSELRQALHLGKGRDFAEKEKIEKFLAQIKN